MSPLRDREEYPQKSQEAPRPARTSRKMPYEEERRSRKSLAPLSDDDRPARSRAKKVRREEFQEDSQEAWDWDVPVATTQTKKKATPAKSRSDLSLEDDDDGDVEGGRTFVLPADNGAYEEEQTFDGDLPEEVARALGRESEEAPLQDQKRRVSLSNARATEPESRGREKRSPKKTALALSNGSWDDEEHPSEKRGKARAKNAFPVSSSGETVQLSEEMVSSLGFDEDEDDATPPPEEVLAQREATQSIPLPNEVKNLARATHHGTSQMEEFGDLADSEAPDVPEESEGEDGEPLDENSPEYIQAKFEIPEDAPIDVVIWVTIKQLAYMVLVFLRNHIGPLRGKLDRWIIRTKAQNASRNAQLTVQERRVSWIIMGSLVAFVLGSAAFIGVGFNREKLPDELVIKLLYPYGFQDGVLNNRRFAGYSNVNIEYLGKTVCNEGVEGALPDCFAYEYRAKNLEGFEGKMIVGKNMNGQWELFNPPKDVAAARQAATQRMQKRYARRR